MFTDLRERHTHTDVREQRWFVASHTHCLNGDGTPLPSLGEGHDIPADGAPGQGETAHVVGTH